MSPKTKAKVVFWGTFTFIAFVLVLLVWKNLGMTPAIIAGMIIAMIGIIFAPTIVPAMEIYLEED